MENITLKLIEGRRIKKRGEEVSEQKINLSIRSLYTRAVEKVYSHII